MIGIAIGSEVTVSGLNGPKLKVHHIDSETNMAECIWFDTGLNLNREIININLLESYSEEASDIHGAFPD